MIKHNPWIKGDMSDIEKYYSERDGVPIQYVCTTELRVDNVPVDIFYRDTPHPEFGNRYFGLLWNTALDTLMITNADAVEDLSFALVEDDEGQHQYSRYRHDYLQFENGNMIDGGRAYVRSSGEIINATVVDGVMKTV